MSILNSCILIGVFFFACYFTKYLCSPISRLTLIDQPNERSLHTAPTPRTGGVAVLSAWGVGLLSFFCTSALPDTDLLWILMLTFLLAVVSVWDDKRGLSPVLRFTLHLGVSVFLVSVVGLKIESIVFPLGNTLYLKAFAFPTTALLVMWMINLYNFMDGMDGFAGGMTFIGFGFLSFITWSHGNETQLYPMLTLMAAVLGFLIYNFPPAKIFLGDVGSISMGFLAAAFGLKGICSGFFDVIVFTLIFLPFIVDATSTLLRRLISGQKVWQAHREHCYQRLVLSGWGHRRVVMVEYVLMLASGVSAIVYLHSHRPLQLALLSGWCLIYAVLMFCLHRFESKRKKQCPQKP